MNPVEYLESCGWYNDNKRLSAKKDKQAGYWKLTLKDQSILGQDSVNLLSGYLCRKFDILHVTIKNHRIPSIIICSLDHKPDPYDCFLHMTLQQKPYKHSDYKITHIGFYLEDFEFGRITTKGTVTIQRIHKYTEYSNVTISSKHRLDKLIKVYCELNTKKSDHAYERYDTF